MMATSMEVACAVERQQVGQGFMLTALALDQLDRC